MHVNVPLCLNEVDFRVSIASFVVSYAKIIVVKILCLDYVDVREARSRGFISATRFQPDKANVLKRPDLKSYVTMLLILIEGNKIIFIE